MLDASMAMESMRNANLVNTYQGNAISASNARMNVISNGSMPLSSAIEFDKSDSFNRERNNTMLALTEANSQALQSYRDKNPPKGVNYVA